jgi:hypothetical protein
MFPLRRGFIYQLEADKVGKRWRVRTAERGEVREKGGKNMDSMLPMPSIREEGRWVWRACMRISVLLAWSSMKVYRSAAKKLS